MEYHLGDEISGETTPDWDLRPAMISGEERGVNKTPDEGVRLCVPLSKDARRLKC